MRRREVLLAACTAVGAGLWPTRRSWAGQAESRDLDTPARPVGVAIVGLGGYGRFALERLRATPGLRVAALVSGDHGKASGLARDLGLPPDALYDYDGFDRIAADDRIDAVHLCLPVGLHAPFATRALDAGKHVLCEKPLASSAEEASALIAHAERRGRLLMPAYRAWFSAHVQELRRRVHTQAHGSLVAIDAHKGFRMELPADNWRFRRNLAGGGCLCDIGIYSLQLCRWVAGRVPTRVMASASYDDARGGREGLEDHLAFLLDFGAGVTATGSASWRHRLQNRVQVATREASLRLDPATPAIGEQLEVALDAPARLETPLLPPRDQLPAMYQHFAQCVRTGSRPSIDAQDGLDDLRVVEALYAAVRSGGWVEV